MVTAYKVETGCPRCGGRVNGHIALYPERLGCFSCGWREYFPWQGYRRKRGGMRINLPYIGMVGCRKEAGPLVIRMVPTLTDAQASSVSIRICCPLCRQAEGLWAWMKIWNAKRGMWKCGQGHRITLFHSKREGYYAWR